MTIFWSIILGIIQGLTEFLPVSSSAHLVIAQHYIPGFSQPGVLFDVVLHLGTLLAVLIYFYKIILKLEKKYYLLVIIGTIPAGFAGVFFQDTLEKSFGDFNTIGFQLIITGVLNILIDKGASLKKTMTYMDSIWIGVAQAIAIIPGISRSGSTIFTGVKLGLDKEKAAQFSFLLSVPAILGAGILQIKSYGFTDIGNPINYIVGSVAAFLAGLWSIKLVYKSLSQRKFGVFGIYCIILGVIVSFLR